MGDEEKPKLKLTLKLGELVNEIEDDREKHKEHKKKKKNDFYDFSAIFPLLYTV